MKYLPLILLISGCAHQDNWTRQDTTLQLVATAMYVGDAITTEKIQYYPGVYEAGPMARAFIGPQPSTSDTYLYFGSVIVTSYLISRALPAKWRPYWQGWEIATHGYAIQQNCANGLC